MSPITPTPTPQQVEESKRRELISGLVVGALVILARIVVPMIPGLFAKVSLNEVNGYCTGAVGLLVRGLGGPKVAAGCDRAGHVMLALNLGAAAGAVLVIICGAFLLVRAQR